MKTLTLLITIFTMAALFAESEEETMIPAAKPQAALKREIADLEKQLLQIKSRLEVLNQQLNVNAPIKPMKGDITINVLRSGNVTVDNNELTQKLLEKNLRRIAAESKDVRIIIRGERKVEYKTVVDIIDICQKAGIPNISFAAQKQKN